MHRVDVVILFCRVNSLIYSEEQQSKQQHSFSRPDHQKLLPFCSREW